MLMTLMNCYPVKITKNLLEHRNFFLWPALFWMAIVTFLCLINSNELPKVEITNYDKLGHITFHFGITFLWFLYFRLQRSNADRKALLKAFLVSFVYGVCIEISQGLFTDTRNADVFDVFANMTGSVIAVILCFFINKRISARANK